MSATNNTVKGLTASKVLVGTKVVWEGVTYEFLGGLEDGDHDWAFLGKLRVAVDGQEKKVDAFTLNTVVSVGFGLGSPWLTFKAGHLGLAKKEAKRLGREWPEKLEHLLAGDLNYR